VLLAGLAYDTQSLSLLLSIAAFFVEAGDGPGFFLTAGPSSSDEDEDEDEETAALFLGAGSDSDESLHPKPASVTTHTHPPTSQ